MFDIGFWEILLIVVLALIVIGPERLPGAARKAGYWAGRARRFVEGVRSEVESEVDLGEFKRLLHNQEVQINELQSRLQGEVTNLGDLQADLKMDDLTAASSHLSTDEETPEGTNREKNRQLDWETNDDDAESSGDRETTADKGKQPL